MVYRVQLDNFDGPLDLLLFLIKKNEVDLFDIPIAEITRQYLEYLDVLKLLDLEAASDYILMAATLIRIKARMLLPRPETEEGEDEEEDPREELVRQLLEYQRFKEVSIEMASFERARRQRFTRGSFHEEFGDEDEVTWEIDTTYTLFDLISSFKDILNRAPIISHHKVQQIPVTTEEQIGYILQTLDTHDGQILFYEMIEQLQNRIAMIVTFLALLELIRMKRVMVTQSSTFGEIWIKRTA